MTGVTERRVTNRLKCIIMGLDSKIVKAVKRGDVELFKSLHGEGSNLMTTVGDSLKRRTLLHHAAQRGFIEIVNYLLKTHLVFRFPHIT